MTKYKKVAACTTEKAGIWHMESAEQEATRADAVWLCPSSLQNRYC